MNIERYISYEMDVRGSQIILEINHARRTIQMGASVNSRLRRADARRIPLYELEFKRDNALARGYMDLGYR